MKKYCVSFLNETLIDLGTFEVIFNVLIDKTKSGVTGWYGISSISTFVELAFWFWQWLDQFAFPPAVCEGPHPNILASICVSNDSHSVWGEKKSQYDFNLHFLDDWGNWIIFSYAYQHLYIISWELYVDFIRPFIIQVVCFFYIFLKKSVYVFFQFIAYFRY